MAFTTYKHGISTDTTTPTGDAGLAINNNFKTIGDLFDAALTTPDLDQVLTAGSASTQPIAVGTFSCDGGQISSDGSGNLTVAENLTVLGSGVNLGTDGLSLQWARDENSDNELTFAFQEGTPITFDGEDGATFGKLYTASNTLDDGDANVSIAGLFLQPNLCGNGTYTAIGDYNSLNNGTSVSVSDDTQQIQLIGGLTTISSNALINGQTTLSNYNSNYTNTGGAGAVLVLSNSDATGQNVVYSEVNNIMVAKWRTDYVGNISWVSAGASGSHTFYTGGDFGTGHSRLSIANGGNVGIGQDYTPTALFDVDGQFKVNASTMGFFGATPVSKPTAAATTTGFAASTGTTVVSGSTFTGGIGTTPYTIGDIVRCLKTLGLLTA